MGSLLKQQVTSKISDQPCWPALDVDAAMVEKASEMVLRNIVYGKLYYSGLVNVMPLSFFQGYKRVTIV